MGPSSARARVLIVDDEPMLATTLRVLLSDTYDVTVASSGDSAVQLLSRDPAFDAVLCDLMMPKVSGIDLYRWMARREPELARRTIFMTGGAFTDESHAFLESVDNPRMAKPFDVDALTRLIETTLAQV